MFSLLGLWLNMNQIVSPAKPVGQAILPVG
ncbi:MAG: hypothetical protein AW09_000030 [Candidatus Accumulibacter phosphatis]|uniref:Uncharacterized protein n=1 Tax=Candidatus Accumulibacter phosphatis TaxID=327160 RepID=A0A080M064_9PROT|nr:MAG: hypothetical protein AW09_000030 [Candidatus Accumulibacter phosphatis]